MIQVGIIGAGLLARRIWKRCGGWGHRGGGAVRRQPGAGAAKARQLNVAHAYDSVEALLASGFTGGA
jgi:predicted dehydrogenase